MIINMLGNRIALICVAFGINTAVWEGNKKIKLRRMFLLKPGSDFCLFCR